MRNRQKPHIRMDGGCWVVEAWSWSSRHNDWRWIICNVFMTFEGAASLAWAIWTLRDASKGFRHGGPLP
jgi:hypothetical protein